MRGCLTLPTNLLHGWPVMGTPNRSTSKRLIPPSRSAGRATIASRDRHSSTLIAHRPNQHHPRISDASIDAHRLMLKFQIFLARTESLVAEPGLTDSPCDQPYIRDEEILDSIKTYVLKNMARIGRFRRFTWRVRCERHRRFCRSS